MKRQEQRIEDTWNLQDLYATDELYEKDCRELERRMEAFAGCAGRLAQACEDAGSQADGAQKDAAAAGGIAAGAQKLAEVLGQYEVISCMFEKLYVYANQKNHEDTSNAKYQKLSGEMTAMSAKFGEATAWMVPEILSIPQEVLDAYLQEEPLRGYEWFLEQITRNRAHVLDAQTEALLSRAGELGASPSNIFSMFNNADVRFPEITDETGEKHELTQGTYISYLESKDRTLRKAAFESLYSVYGQFSNTLAAAYYANAKQADFFAKEHNYANTMESELGNNAIPVSVHTKLVETVNERLPLMHRYVRLRKQLLGLDELHMYDVYVPMVESPDRRYTFEEAKEIVKRGLALLGEDYLAILQEGFDNRWIDIYENQGKRTGAYSWGAYGTHPYVLLNFHGTLNDVFTLAHEMGHALHTYHSNAAQPYRYSGYRIFVAEVASTCNEALLIHDLLNRTDDQAQRRYLINYFLDQFKGTMYRQTMFAEFEMVTHQMVNQGETLTAEQISAIYLDLNRRYFGDDIICDPEIAYEWARIPHFYTPFYVYQYATGFAAAIAISSKILKGEPGIVEKYKKFLSSGGSMDPIDLLKICGVDMSSEKPVEEALDVFEEYLSELERSV